ncbi:MAG: C2H2-type zinc finger protein [Halobaculum sp.]
MSRETERADHTCDICGESFDDRRELRRHVREQGIVV